MAPAARSVSTRSGTATPITTRRAAGGAHGARAWSTSLRNVRGQLVLLDDQARPNRRCSQAPGFDTATVTTRPSRIGEADAVLVTVAAPTKPNRRPARRHRRWRHTRSVVVTLDGA